MEALEKVYISPELDRRWYYPKKVGCYNTEYIRTDAFIEKVCTYLKEHLIDYWSQSVTDESHFIENLKNYMKGE